MKTTQEQSHKTKSGYCCACDYDIACFEKKIADTEARVREEIIITLEKMKKESLKLPERVLESDTTISQGLHAVSNEGYNNALADAIEAIKGK